MPERACFIDWFPNRPVELRRGRTYYMGRGRGNEIFIPDAHASRKHAHIKWDGEAFVVTDLNSANGTFVNNGPITEHVLQPGDQIQIGTHVLSFRVEESAGPEEDYERQSREVQEWKTVIGYRPADGGFSGAIGEVQLAEVVQVFESSRKTGRLYITATGLEGSLYFRDGRIIAADYSTTSGDTDIVDEEAAYALLALEEGIFEFLSEDVSVETRIHKSAQALLLESMRRLDEGRSRKDTGPSPGDTQML